MASSFSEITDWFNLASSALEPIASESGGTIHRVTPSNGGKYSDDVNDGGGIWRNPSVTYVVKANTTVVVKLGKGFAGGTNVSGYMITTVSIVTAIGQFPVVTVSAVANEGADAINNFSVNQNKFNVSVPVVARSKAQNLLGAISGGGHLQRCSLVATCDPVVCEKDLMPCASDIVNGRYEISADTVAPAGEAAPSAAYGFSLLSLQEQRIDCDYVKYAATARKEMV